jgi:hypothetical protein
MRYNNIHTIEGLEREAEQDESAMSTGAYWARRNEILDSDAKAAVAYARSSAGRAEHRDRTINALIGIRIDSGLTPDQKAELARLEAEVEAERQAADSAFRAIWTPEVIRIRREKWNVRVRAGEFGKIGSGRVDLDALRAAEENQGWAIADLKRAIRLDG